MSEKINKLEDKIKELKAEGEKDCKFDKSKMETQFDNTSLMMKWIAKKQEFSNLLRQLEYKRAEAHVKLLSVYRTESALKLTTKAEIDLHLSVDKQFVEHDALFKICKDAVVMIGEILEAIKSKNYEIKRYIEYQMFINGK